ncbi:hypothetical protein [Mesorhizobium sp.]|nr:hypothetical protein [Mesorhizobium sp.]
MATDLAPRMRCTACKRRAVEFSHTPDATKHSGMGVWNAYAKARDGR